MPSAQKPHAPLKGQDRKTVLQFLIKSEIRLTEQPSSPTPRSLPQRNEDVRQHQNLRVNVHSSFLDNCREWKQPQRP